MPRFGHDAAAAPSWPIIVVTTDRECEPCVIHCVIHISCHPLCQAVAKPLTLDDRVKRREEAMKRAKLHNATAKERGEPTRTWREQLRLDREVQSRVCFFWAFFLLERCASSRGSR